MSKVIGYYYDEGIRYDVYDTDTTEELGQFQDRNYGNVINNKTKDVFDEDK